MTHLLAAIGLPYIPGWDELRPFAADLWLIVTIVAVLITPFFTTRSNIACALVALAGVTLAFLSQLLVRNSPHVIGEHFRGLLVMDQFAMLWKLLLLLFVAGVILTAGYMLWTIQRVFFGPEKAEYRGFPEVNPREMSVLTPLTVMAIALGVVPTLCFFVFTQTTVNALFKLFS